MGRKKSRFYADRPKHIAVDTNVLLIDPVSCPALSPPSPSPVPPAPESKMSKRRRVQLEKYLAKKAKKEERPLLMQRLQTAAFVSTVPLHSTKMLLVPSRRSVKIAKARPVSSSEEEEEKPPSAQTVREKKFERVVVSSIPDFAIDMNAAIASIRKSSINPLAGEEKKDSKNEASSDEEDSKRSDLSQIPTAKDVLLPPTRTYYSLVRRSAEMEEQRARLPIFGEEQMIMETIRNNPITIICGETGSGKTTQVPQFLYEAGFGDAASPNPGLIGVTQPRRVAAVSVSKRVGEELCTPEHVAYQIRYETTVRAGTRIKFMTDGILLRELVDDFLLTKYSVILLDEAHERNLNTDILIGILSRVVRMRNARALERPGETHPLRVVIMSATLNVDEFLAPALFSPPPPVINVEARQHPVTIHFSKKTNPDYLTETFKMVRKIHSNLPPGGILVFLTGKQEIVQLARKLHLKYGASSSARWAEEQGSDVEEEQGWPTSEEEQDTETPSDHTTSEPEQEFALKAESREPLHVLPLYALLAPEQQLKVFDPPPEGSRLCVLATNVAETSLTIPNIRYVVDCGLVKQRFYDAATGAQEYDVDWISKASATQRAGRAGRVGPGHCYRLYSSAVFDQQFPPFSLPEIQRTCIDALVLRLKSMGIDRAERFPLPSSPHPDTVLASQNALLAMGALARSPADDQIKITPLGRLMSRLALAPCWARMVVVAVELGSIPTPALALGAVLSVGDPFLEGQLCDASGDVQKGSSTISTRLELAGNPPTSDVLVWLNAFIEYEGVKTTHERRDLCKRRCLLEKRMEEMLVQFKSLCRSIATLYPNLALPPLSTVRRSESAQLRRLLAESLPERLAERIKNPAAGTIANFKRLSLPAYRLLGRPADDAKSIVYLHPTSVLLRIPPKLLVYSELLLSGETQYVKDVSAIEMGWLPK